MFLSLLGLLPAPDQAAEAQTKRPRPRTTNPYQQTESQYFPWRAIVEVESTFVDSDPTRTGQFTRRSRSGWCYKLWGGHPDMECDPAPRPDMTHSRYCTGLMIGPRHVLMAGDCIIPVGAGNVSGSDGTFTATVHPYGKGIRGQAGRARVIRSRGDLLYLDRPIGLATHSLVLAPQDTPSFSADFLGFYNYWNEKVPIAPPQPGANPLNLKPHTQYLASVEVKTSSSICNGQPHIEIPTKAQDQDGDYSITYMRGFVLRMLPHETAIIGSSFGRDSNNPAITCLWLFQSSADYASIIDWMRQNP